MSKEGVIYVYEMKRRKGNGYVIQTYELNRIDYMILESLYVGGCKDRFHGMTITEISIVGKPSIFIPLPSMSANRQEDNALVLKKLGAAKIILNNVVDGKKLSEEIDEIIENSSELEEMGKIASTIAPTDTNNTMGGYMVYLVALLSLSSITTALIGIRKYRRKNL